MNDVIYFDWLYFPNAYLRAALAVSLLSVWVLIGLFYYLNHYTKRRYFNIWTAAWLFYALWLVLSLTLESVGDNPMLLMLKHICVGISAVFLLWGAARFLGQRTPQKLFGLFIAFLVVWSYVGAYELGDSLQSRVPLFSLIALASWLTSGCFYRFRSRCKYIGAGLLSFGFGLWGLYMAGYPFLQSSEHMICAGFFVSAVLQLFIAVSMIILVLEEVRHSNQEALQQIRTEKTERARLETMVITTEERYQSLFDQASEGIVIARANDLSILEMNHTARRLLGVTGPGDPVQPLNRFCRVPVKDLPDNGPDWFNVIRQKRRFNVERKDGGLTPVEADGALIEFEGAPAYQIFFREQTETARLEQQLRQSEKLSALGGMISGVAHEINNPLTVIKGFLELVLARHELAPATRSDLEKVVQEANRAAKLVGNFLSFAREQPSNRETVDLNELIRRVFDLRNSGFASAGIEPRMELAASLPTTQADPDQILQVIVNLVNNALFSIKDQPQPRWVRVQSMVRDGMIRVLVQDNGPGVPDHLVDRIFEPFFTTKEVGSGTGLGLSIAHGIMSEHGGRIRYESSPGDGATFALEFPIISAPAGDSVKPAAVRVPEPRTITPANILVLDDEPAIGEMLGEMLTLLGHNPTLCQSARNALVLISARDFDLVLSDFRMPVMNGQEFYKLAVERNPSLADRIIFLTGDTVSEDTRVFLDSSGNPYLGKPFQLATVEKVIAEVLAKPNPGRQPVGPG